MANYKHGGIFIERELYQSDAFLSLGKNAIKVLFAILDNRKRETGKQAKDKKGNQRKRKFINLDRLEVPYGTLEKVYKINRSSIPKAIDELLAKGFIKISYHGGACKHDKSKYALSDNYLFWTPNTAPFESRPKREQHGYQGRRIGATNERVKQPEIITGDFSRETHAEKVRRQASEILKAEGR
jgi:hypothetical protein